jgi:hypothetical protein
MKWKFGVKGPAAVAMAAAMAVATVVPGGAVSASAQEPTQVSDGLSFEAFVTALADEATQTAVQAAKDQYAALAPVLEAATGDPNFGSDLVNQQLDSIPSVVHDAVNQAVAQLPPEVGDELDQIDLPEIPQIDLGDLENQADEEEQNLADADAQEIIDALLALLNPTELQVNAAIDAAEAAVLALIDDARAKAVAAFAQTDMPELEAYVLAQIDAARVLVQQAFDQIRAQVAAAFAQARSHIINDLVDIPFGEAKDEVLAKIAEIQGLLTGALAHVQEILNGLNLGSLGN